MSSNKAYPNPEKLRRQSKLACHAIHDLAELHVQVLTVSFAGLTPVIEVLNCRNNRKMKGHFTGQGVNGRGQHYHTLTTVFCGCAVRWQEVQHG